MKLEEFQVKAGYSRLQVFTVMELMKYTEERAYALVDFMDSEGEHPDWSEYSTAELRRHFREVVAYEAELVRSSTEAGK